MKRLAILIALCVVATATDAVARGLQAVGTRYGTLSPAAQVIDAPPLVCTGYEYITNWVETTTETNMVVSTNGIWTATDSITEPTANRLGYKLVVDTPPITDTNHYAVATGWEEREAYPAVVLMSMPPQYQDAIRRIYRVYEILPLPPAPARRIYKYDLSAACVEYDRLDDLMGFINTDAKVKWFWDAAEILVEDDAFFIAATNQVIQSGAIPEAEVKRILDRAYELGQLTEVSK